MHKHSEGGKDDSGRVLSYALSGEEYAGLSLAHMRRLAIKHLMFIVGFPLVAVGIGEVAALLHSVIGWPHGAFRLFWCFVFAVCLAEFFAGLSGLRVAQLRRGSRQADSIFLALCAFLSIIAAGGAMLGMAMSVLAVTVLAGLKW